MADIHNSLGVKEREPEGNNKDSEQVKLCTSFTYDEKTAWSNRVLLSDEESNSVVVAYV